VLLMDTLLAELRRRLPGYLVPDVLVQVDAWPLTTSGKVDRARLPRPRRSERTDYQPPQSPVEVALAAIAAGLLGMERVGRHDNLRAGRTLPLRHPARRPGAARDAGAHRVERRPPGAHGRGDRRAAG
jgi:hypothetical protein